MADGKTRSQKVKLISQLKLTSTAFKLPKWCVISDDIISKKIQVCLEFLAKVVNLQYKEKFESMKTPTLRIYICSPPRITVLQ